MPPFGSTILMPLSGSALCDAVTIRPTARPVLLETKIERIPGQETNGEEKFKHAHASQPITTHTKTPRKVFLGKRNSQRTNKIERGWGGGENEEPSLSIGRRRLHLEHYTPPNMPPMPCLLRPRRATSIGHPRCLQQKKAPGRIQAATCMHTYRLLKTASMPMRRKVESSSSARSRNPRGGRRRRGRGEEQRQGGGGERRSRFSVQDSGSKDF